MSVKIAIWAYGAVLVGALAFLTLTGSEGPSSGVAWLFVAASAGTAAATWYLSANSDGLVRDFTRLLSIGFLALTFAYLSYRVFPMPDPAYPAFGDGLWCTAFAVFFAAGVKGTLVIADLSFRDGRRDIMLALLIGAVLTLVMHFLVGRPALGEFPTDSDRAVYRAGVFMMLVALYTGALYVIVAVRSFGGQYASLLILMSAFNLFGGIADFVYGALHPSVSSGISPASTLTPMGDVSDWIRLSSFLVILALVVRQLGKQEQARAAVTQPAAV